MDELEISAGQFDMCKHDCTVTISNPATGNHRTFRIRTKQKGALEGKRIVELLTGPDNTGDYLGFGFVEDGQVKVWRKNLGTPEQPSEFEVLARMLMNPAYWERKGAEYRFALRCRRCGRKLTHPESIDSGYGPECIKMV